MPFPSQVQTQPAPAVAGDFCSQNPMFSVTPGQGAFAAGPALFVGRFAWADPTFSILNSAGSGPPTGFVHREQQGLITTFLAESSVQVLIGTQCYCLNGGDFWMENDGLLVATPGMKAYARFADGKVTFGPTGTPPGGGTSSASTISAQTFSVTGSIGVQAVPPGSQTGQTGNDEIGVLTVTVVGSGTIVPGAAISGTGIQAGTLVTGQLTGTPGGVGTYSVNIPQTAASTTVSGTYGLLTVGGSLTGTFGIGDVLSGSGGGGVTAGSTITGLGTGTGGAGTYYTQTQTVSSTAINATSAIETKWVCQSVGQVGELVRTSSQPFG